MPNVTTKKGRNPNDGGQFQGKIPVTDAYAGKLTKALNTAKNAASKFKSLIK